VETDLAGGVQHQYAFFNGKRVARRDADNSVRYYFSDHLGSASIITNEAGAMPPITESDYYPYGGEMVISGGDANHYKFTGKERDPESGLDDFGARFDASSLGRFMSPDWAGMPATVPYAEFGDPQTLNLYGYVRNNPLITADLNGHETGMCYGCGSAGQDISVMDPSFQDSMSDTEKQIDIGILELGSAVATGGTLPELVEAGGALKTAIVAIQTTGLAVSGSSRIIATAAGAKPEDVEHAATAETTITNPAGFTTTVATNGNERVGALASDVSSAVSIVKKPVDAVKDPAGTALTVGNLLEDIKAFVSPPAPVIPTPKPPVGDSKAKIACTQLSGTNHSNSTQNCH
jgi:RHS repeat-associated protein